jgi:ATP-binding cassette, subfamily G (WHITE), member 2, PDR
MSFVGGGQFGSYDSSIDRSGPGHSTNPNASRSHEESEKSEIDSTTAFTGDATGDAKALKTREDEVHQLARRITQHSIQSEVEGVNPVFAGPDSKVNPNSPNFSAKSWAKAALRLQEEDGNNPVRTAGVAFRNLNVYGFGAATDYQKTVGNVWLSTVGIVRKLLNIGQRRIDILRDFEGLVRAGEMCIVLGPPGSGCTTFLKTVSGDWHGFNVDSEAYINYQGTVHVKTSNELT